VTLYIAVLIGICLGGGFSGSIRRGRLRIGLRMRVSMAVAFWLEKVKGN